MTLPEAPSEAPKVPAKTLSSQNAAPAAGVEPLKPTPAVVPSTPTVIPATISAATRQSLEAAQTQLETEAKRAGVVSFSIYALTRFRDAIASGQAEQVKKALQEIRRSPELEKLSSGLKDRLSTLQGEVEGILEKPLRNTEERLGNFWKGLPKWARGGLMVSGGMYGIVKIVTWLLKKIRAGWDKSKAVMKGALKWGAIFGGSIGAGILAKMGYDKFTEKKDTPPGGTAA